MRGARRFFSREKQVFLVSFSLTSPRFPRISNNRLNSSLVIQKQSFADVLENTCSLQCSQKNKHLCWSNFIKKRLQHRCFPVEYPKFLRTLFLQNTSGGCFWKHLVISFFIAHENDEWRHFVVRIGSPALIPF